MISSHMSISLTSDETSENLAFYLLPEIRASMKNIELFIGYNMFHGKTNGVKREQLKTYVTKGGFVALLGLILLKLTYDGKKIRL